MNSSKVLNGILFFAGLIATAIGAAILFAPIGFYASYGTTIAPDFSLLNEIRAVGGGLLASGLLITAGAFWHRLAFAATLVAVSLYLPYSLARVMSIVVDGMPAEGFVQAAVLELIIGMACLFALIKYRAKRVVGAC